MVWAGASLVLGIVLLIADLISENRKYRKTRNTTLQLTVRKKAPERLPGRGWSVASFSLSS